MYNGLSFIPTKLNRSIEYCDALAFNSLFVILLLYQKGGKGLMHYPWLKCLKFDIIKASEC